MSLPPANKNTSPFSIPNVRLFIAFRVFFNSRFYYPVFTILFLDFGLSVAQFSILNAAWAVSIVLAEVPLGALADIIGRKRLLVGATLVMIVEISLICFVPKTHTLLVFVVFLINRMLSGFAEAAASGADEAIAYDSLEDPNQWGRVLEVLARFQSIGFILAMTIGAAVYDPALMERVCRFLGMDIRLDQEITMRFPLYLTLVLSFGALISTLKMEDIDVRAREAISTSRIRQAFDLTFKAGLWIVKTPFALSVILFGMLFDGMIRMVITLSSQYYRMIDLPESIFGILGSLVAMLGFIVPGIARRLAENAPVSTPLWLTAGLTLTGLGFMNLFLPYVGVLPALVTFSAMYFTGFFVSFHINKTASSGQRATVLSFKGLAYNVSYGALGILYALGLKLKKQDMVVTDHIQDVLFMDTFYWFPAAFLVCFVLLLIGYHLWLKPDQ